MLVSYPGDLDGFYLTKLEGDFARYLTIDRPFRSRISESRDSYPGGEHAPYRRGN